MLQVKRMSDCIESRPEVSFDMLHAFSVVARTLNVSEAAARLRVTRQTLRRYIGDLETIIGKELLTLERGRYRLTPFGSQFLHDTRIFLNRAHAWDGRNRYTLHKVNGFEHAQYLDSDGRAFYSQQHGISSVTSKSPPIVREFIRAWGSALALLGHRQLAKIRPYLVIYRRTQTGWICADVGEKSAYRRWFGPAWAESAKGALSEDDQVGAGFNTFISGAYSEIYLGGNIRLDHLYAYLPRDGSDTSQPVSFQRVLAGCAFPDGQRALVALVAMTNQIEITALDDQSLPPLPGDLAMDSELLQV